MKRKMKRRQGLKILGMHNSDVALSVASFANIFSCSWGCLIVLFMVFFAVPKLLSLINSHLLIFVLFTLL